MDRKTRKSTYFENRSTPENDFAIFKNYFDAGHTYDVIVDMLSTNHNIRMSIHTLKSRLRDAGLYRRKNFSQLDEVRHAILTELRGPGQLFGYRTMWQVLQQKHKLRVKRHTVMRLLKQLNPQEHAGGL